MKRQVKLRIYFYFCLFIVAGFILLSTFFSGHLTGFIQKKEAEQLYREALTIASNYAADYYSDSMSSEELSEQLEVFSEYNDSHIWLVNRNGCVVVNTDETSAIAFIPNFNVTDFGSRRYIIGDFYGCFPSETLSVFAPVSVDYTVRGYVLIHQPSVNTLGYVNDFLWVVYVSFFLLAIFALLFLLILQWNFYRPLKKILKVIQKYMDGNFDEKMDDSRDDEFGMIAASFNYMAHELNTLEDDQRKFVSNISHDFRSPLTSIKGYLEAILDGTIPYEMQEKYLKIIVFETERLSKLTSGLIELNQYGGHGKTILDKSVFDINETIRNTAQTFEGTCNKKHITLELFLTGDQLHVKADQGKIQQIIYNLIDNAIKFSHNNSSIQIETHITNEKAFISVKDSGIGIPKNSQSKIWERFYKSDLSRGKDKTGTGIGLAIVKEIIQAHNENINVISTEGVGTEFIFSLPFIDNVN